MDVHGIHMQGLHFPRVDIESRIQKMLTELSSQTLGVIVGFQQVVLLGDSGSSRRDSMEGSWAVG